MIIKGAIMKIRDSQRSKVYEAERTAMRAYWSDPSNLLSLQDCQELADVIMYDPWVRRRWPKASPIVKVVDPPKHRRAACARSISGQQILLPPWSRQAYLVIHELAHHLVGWQYHGRNPQPIPAHGAEFASAVLELTERFMGKYHAKVLHDSFVKHKVRFRGGKSQIVLELAAAGPKKD